MRELIKLKQLVSHHPGLHRLLLEAGGRGRDQEPPTVFERWDHFWSSFI